MVHKGANYFYLPYTLPSIFSEMTSPKETVVTPLGVAAVSDRRPDSQ